MDGSWGGSCPDCWGVESCLKPDGGYLTQGCYQVPDAECEANGVARPDEVCRTSGPDAWIYTFVLQCQKCTVPGNENCSYRYEYVTKDCSAADRCEDPGIGNIPGACGGGGIGRGEKFFAPTERLCQIKQPRFSTITIGGGLNPPPGICPGTRRRIPCAAALWCKNGLVFCCNMRYNVNRIGTVKGDGVQARICLRG